MVHIRLGSDDRLGSPVHFQFGLGAAFGCLASVRQGSQTIAPPSPSQILAKVEGRNPAYSVKCRIGASMIWDAEASGHLRPGMSIVEPTSGNTGVAQG